jgi:hypothetical protein
MKFNSSDKVNLGSLTLAFLAFMLSIYSTFKSCSSEKELKRTNYEFASIEHRPRLKLSNPTITSISLKADSLPLKRTKSIKDSIGEVLSELSLSLNIKITNIGNHTAKFDGYVLSDTTAEDPMLKRLLKNPVALKNNSKDTLVIPHIYKELSPLDTMNISLSYSPQYIKDDKFIIHLLIFYENELGQVFDTYYWITFQTHYVIVPNPLYFGNNKQMKIKMARAIFKSVEIKDENNYSSPYSDEEKKILMKNTRK